MLGRHAGVLVGDRVEARKAATDDLVSGVAEETFGAGVPAGDFAVAAQHADRVVMHAVEEQPQAILRLAQAIGLSVELGVERNDAAIGFLQFDLGVRCTRDAACGSVRRRIPDPAHQPFRQSRAVRQVVDPAPAAGDARPAGTAPPEPIERPTGRDSNRQLVEHQAQRLEHGAQTEPDRCRSSVGCGIPPGATGRRRVRDRRR